MNEFISKRPKSGKFTQLKPLSTRPKTALEINNKESELQKNLPTLETKVKTESIDENKNENNQNLKEQLSEKTQFLEVLGDEVDKETFNNILSNEVNRIKNINEKKTKLKEINLLEKNYGDLKNFDELYDWTNLFNNSRPISSYTTLKKPKLSIKEDKKTEEFKSPVILVDLFEEQMNLYFGDNFFRTDSKDSKNKINNKKNIENKKLGKNNNINTLTRNNNKEKKLSIKKSQNINFSKTLNHTHLRPMSVYSPRENACSFYFSSAFSDYYKEDLKSFSEKMKILKAKVKSKPYKLNNEIKNQRKISSKKELILNRLLNLEQFNFGKSNLIIAGKRRNPIPLLKSIFKKQYPDKEVMKENIKLYYNTMKPFGEKEGIIDYTQNERWRPSQEIAELREGAKDLKFKNSRNWTNYNSFNLKKNRKRNNLILNYYNKEDPYILLFEKMARNGKSFKEKKETNEKNNVNGFNPILQNLSNNNFSVSYNKKFIEKKNSNKSKKENSLEENKEENKANINTDINIRPKTSYRSIGLNIKNTLVKRPLTSTIKQYNIYYSDLKQDKNSILPENYLDPNSNLDYISSNCFPLKTISNVGNTSYDKINQMIQERQFIKLKNDYFMTSTGQTKSSSKTPKYKEEKIIFEKNNNIKNKILVENNKWNETFNKYKSNKKNKINYYNFDNIIDNFIEKKKKAENFYTMKYFKNMGGKYYSSSNNVNVKNKRNNKLKLLNNYYTESKYSRDDQEREFDFVDEGVSSQSNSSYRKI